MSESNISYTPDELKTINEITRNIIGTIDYQEVLQFISNGMSELLNIEKGAIYMLEDHETLYLAAATPPLPPGIPESFRKTTLSDNPIIQRAVKTQKNQYIPDSNKATLSPVEKEIIELSQVTCLLYLPLLINKKVAGILILSTGKPNKKYTDKELELAQVVANQLTSAIQKTKLHRELVQHKDKLEELVVQRTHELEATNEELEAANEELISTNEELFTTNELVSKQKEKLEKTLAQLQATQSRLIQSEKMASLGILTSGVAHELNNPLNFINGAYTGLEEFFQNSAVEYKEEVTVFMNALKTGISRSANIVRGLNQFSSTNNELNEECDINAILDNCLTMIQNKTKDRIIIDKKYSPEQPVIIGNSGNLHQVFINLLSNAEQAIPENGKIQIHTKKVNNDVVIDILDNGIGIPEKNLPKLADPFFTTKAPGMGTGLGLSITYNIIKEHDGSIEFTSEKNEGTRVRIILPLLNT